MTETDQDPVNRLQRRKQRTRAALIKAARTLVAQGRLNVPVLEITRLADVGMGSFYNHFRTKEELFEAAVVDVLGEFIEELRVCLHGCGAADLAALRRLGVTSG